MAIAMGAEEEAVSQLDNVLRCSNNDEETTAAALQRLIQLSRSPAVRSVLATHDAVPSILPLIAQNNSALFDLLKLLRNLCAGDRFNQEAFLRSNGVHVVALVVDRALDIVHLEVSLLQVCLQLIGNVCGGGNAQKDAVWKVFFPNKFSTLALVKHEDKILEPLSMVIYTCCHENIHLMKDLCLPNGAFIVSSCLQAMTSTDGALCKSAGDWICFLVLGICSEQSLGPLLFASLRGPSKEGISDRQFTEEQVDLLGCLVDVLDEEHSHDIVQKNRIDLLVIIEFLAQILRDASQSYFTSNLTNPSIVSHASGPCGTPVINVLGYTLVLLKSISGFDCDRQSNSKYDRSLVLNKLLQDGVIELCIELLKGLGPPEMIVRAMQSSNADVIDRRHELQGRDAQEGLPLTEYGEHPMLPYRGYRRDLVAIIGNATYQNRAVQDAVRHSGGLLLILQQCVVDEANPYLREWGLWAVRNLMEGNMENSKELAELQFRGSLTPIELADMGYKVEIDSELRRPKLVNMPSRNG